MSSWEKRHDRLQQEWSVKKLRDEGRRDTVMGISPEMDQRVKNALRRVARKEKAES
ncbi:hypothetical protein Q0Z83_059850 [Actinoplanes sichuanensis]|uniref:Uncharacterized protein n=1 Tax=Actinoplanes sichuanensis TaxID=512349 RepID=A0ABW4A7E0_9ACTN|nr:hypothetical protein [Actinoplanes sichuanensis]BEL07794.1 hypothetical protein Q0Z83_059850 [Actinoplanes sichuanensis]